MKSFRFPILLSLLLSVAGCDPTTGSQSNSQLSSGPLEVSASERFQHSEVIWGFDFISDDEIILTDQAGRMLRVHLPSKKAVEIKNVPEVYHSGQGGLLDVRLHPQFSSNAWVYFTYSVRNDSENSTRLSRARLKENRLEDLEILFTAQAFDPATNHYGSRIAFDGRGHVFVTVGDRTKRDLAQDLTTHMGKVIRLKEDGDIPKDNPFAENSSAKAEIWSYGHRNPQGLFYDSENQELWLHEHGPRGGDEINLIKPGDNYGWPKATYGREYWGPKIGETEVAGTIQPIHMYKPSIAPSGLIRYSGKKFSEWKSDFFLGALVLRHLNRVEIKDGNFVAEERLFENLNERIRHVAESPSGDIYFSTDSGKIFQVRESTTQKD